MAEDGLSAMGNEINWAVVELLKKMGAQVIVKEDNVIVVTISRTILDQVAQMEAIWWASHLVASPRPPRIQVDKDKIAIAIRR